MGGGLGGVDEERIKVSKERSEGEMNVTEIVTEHFADVWFKC